MTKILAFAGSTRRDSWNKKLLHSAANSAKKMGAEVTLIDLADYILPLYDGDLEAAEGVPENALKLKTLFKTHDALLIAAPEYNSSVTPLLKNTLDWVSREWQGESGLAPYQGKVAALLATSPGQFGGMRMLPHLRQILNTLGVLVLPGQVSVPNAAQAFDDHSQLKSPERMDELMQALVHTSDALLAKKSAPA